MTFRNVHRRNEFLVKQVLEQIPRQDGKRYPASTLKRILASTQRHLRSEGIH